MALRRLLRRPDGPGAVGGRAAGGHGCGRRPDVQRAGLRSRAGHEPVGCLRGTPSILAPTPARSSTTTTGAPRTPRTPVTRRSVWSCSDICGQGDPADRTRPHGERHRARPERGADPRGRQQHLRGAGRRHVRRAVGPLDRHRGWPRRLGSHGRRGAAAVRARFDPRVPRHDRESSTAAGSRRRSTPSPWTTTSVACSRGRCRELRAGDRPVGPAASHLALEVTATAVFGAGRPSIHETAPRRRVGCRQPAYTWQVVESHVLGVGRPLRGQGIAAGGDGLRLERLHPRGHPRPTPSWPTSPGGAPPGGSRRW